MLSGTSHSKVLVTSEHSVSSCRGDWVLQIDFAKTEFSNTWFSGWSTDSIGSQQQSINFGDVPTDVWTAFSHNTLLKLTFHFSRSHPETMKEISFRCTVYWLRRVRAAFSKAPSGCPLGTCPAGLRAQQTQHQLWALHQWLCCTTVTAKGPYFHSPAEVGRESWYPMYAKVYAFLTFPFPIALNRAWEPGSTCLHPGLAIHQPYGLHQFLNISDAIIYHQ